MRPNKSSRGSVYVEANATFDLIEKHHFCCFEAGKLNLTLHIGHQSVRHYGQLSYTDWRATLTQNFAWFNAFISYVGTEMLITIIMMCQIMPIILESML